MVLQVRGPAAEAYPSERHGGISDASRREIREILDPCLNTRWLLVADAEHPERPGRLIRMDARTHSGANAGGSDLPSRSSAETDPAPAIRAGDHVTVTQESAMLRARLQAVALEPAAVGQPMRVRLMGGANGLANGLAFDQGTVVRVRAVAAGEAIWLGPVGRLDRNVLGNPVRNLYRNSQ